MFRKAVKNQLKLKIGIAGPSGSGKTYSALSIAQGISENICLLDTEGGASERYADIFNFDVYNLSGNYHPNFLVDAITKASRAGYDVIIIDSISHFWMGQGGILDLVDKSPKKGMQAWADATPLINRIYEAIKETPIHIISTFRVKTEYVEIVKSNGKKAFEKSGLAPSFKDGIEYEFDLFCDIDLDHELFPTKTRISDLNGKSYPNPGKDFGEILKSWAEGGKPLPKATTAIFNQIVKALTDAIKSNNPKLSDKLFNGAVNKYQLSETQKENLIKILDGDFSDDSDEKNEDPVETE